MPSRHVAIVACAVAFALSIGGIFNQTAYTRDVMKALNGGVDSYSDKVSRRQQEATNDGDTLVGVSSAEARFEVGSTSAHAVPSLNGLTSNVPSATSVSRAESAASVGMNSNSTITDIVNLTSKSTSGNVTSFHTNGNIGAIANPTMAAAPRTNQLSNATVTNLKNMTAQMVISDIEHMNSTMLVSSHESITANHSTTNNDTNLSTQGNLNDGSSLAKTVDNVLSNGTILIPLPPYGNVTNRWDYKLRNGGTIYFKHLRKAGGSSMLFYLADTIKYHFDQSRLAGDNSPLKWFLYHQEFTAMPWKCPRIDPRWSSTLSIIILREPIDRHLSEFFYSGPGSRDQLARISKLVMKDAAYEKEWSALMEMHLPGWIEQGLTLEPGRNFNADYQVKMISGVTNMTPPVMKLPIGTGCDKKHQNVWKFKRQELAKRLNDCDKTRNPCHYGGGYNGGIRTRHNVTGKSLVHAKQALESYDLVLLTETFSNSDQARMVADAVRVPTKVNSLESRKANVGRNRYNKTKFEGYKSLLKKTAPHIYAILERYTYYETQLYEHAKILNKRITDQWKLEQGIPLVG